MKQGMRINETNNQIIYDDQNMSSEDEDDS